MPKDTPENPPKPDDKRKAMKLFLNSAEQAMVTAGAKRLNMSESKFVRHIVMASEAARATEVVVSPLVQPANEAEIRHLIETVTTLPELVAARTEAVLRQIVERPKDRGDQRLDRTEAAATKTDRMARLLDLFWPIPTSILITGSAFVMFVITIKGPWK